ncbi:MAG: hypothetical protein RIQ78_859 [Bacteroidota bacterium]|jgi:hypothetical protein
MEVLNTTNFQPDIILWGLRIGEPVIAFSSILVSLVCFNAWYQLGKIGIREDALRLSRIFFLLTGVSTFIGGLVGHAFLYALPFAFKMPGWALGMIAVSALEQASTVRVQPLIGATLAKAITFINIAELTLSLWFVSTTLWFPVVEIHSAFGFLAVILPLEILLIVKTRSKGSRTILWGILLLIGAVLAHLLKISFGVWFSFFDIGHLFMCAAMWKIMIGTEEHRHYASPDLGQTV